MIWSVSLASHSGPKSRNPPYAAQFTTEMPRPPAYTGPLTCQLPDSSHWLTRLQAAITDGDSAPDVGNWTWERTGEVTVDVDGTVVVVGDDVDGTGVGATVDRGLAPDVGGRIFGQWNIHHAPVIFTPRAPAAALAGCVEGNATEATTLGEGDPVLMAARRTIVSTKREINKRLTVHRNHPRCSLGQCKRSRVPRELWRAYWGSGS